MALSIQQKLVILGVQLIFLCGIFSAEGQIALPDTPVGQRMSQLIKCIGESKPEKRAEILAKIFDVDEDPAAVRDNVTAVHEETGGLTLREIVRADEFDMLVEVETGTGELLRLRISVAKDDDHGITDVGLSMKDSGEVMQAVGDLVPLKNAAGETIPEARGVWVARGYGYVIEVKENDIGFYHYSGNIGWKGGEADEMDLYFIAGETNDEARVTGHPKEFGFRITRLEELPEVCRETDWTHTNVFDAFADVMMVHYPFFEQRGVDWQARIKEHRPRVSDAMSENELFDVMESMLKGLGDGHTGLIAEIDGEQRRADTGSPKTMIRIKEAFERQSDFKNVRKMRSKFLSDINQNVMEKVLGGKGEKCCQNQIAWGFADERIGYINIDGMGGYAIGDTDKEVAALHEALNRILTEFADTDAIILDITTNFGGADMFSMEIASHFTKERRLGFSKWPATVKQYRQDRYITPQQEANPQSVTYLKPVYLVTSDLSVSAAEIFTMCMRSIPHVVTVGESTAGALSDVLDKSLPNGWGFHTSNEIYVDHEGICHEGPGIPPMVDLPIFDPDDVMHIVHDQTIRKVLELALKNAQK